MLNLHLLYQQIFVLLWNEKVELPLFYSARTCMYWHAQAFLIWFWMFRIRIPCDRGKRPSNKTQKSNEKGWPRFDILCILNACHVSPIKSRTLGVGRCQKATFQLLLYSLEQENRLFCSSLSMSLRQTSSFPYLLLGSHRLSCFLRLSSISHLKRPSQ